MQTNLSISLKFVVPSFDRWQHTMITLTFLRNALCRQTRILIESPS
ncbi:unnamed protein product [Acanthoscelides obtectus]|uniref:Uncharacterized protein n=1 Tax=Acanthoscelides obtectus TaxID=200917 RepID=A0A9P0KNY5_ACAOB|nr:unnamed protein product [Acanthoscelides obtectus]CAK1627849.1 hypothetical protein AOBTE_LOCUS4861 [Acanthoscelides obtectus]